MRDAIRTPDSRYAYIAPTYKQAKNVAWDYLKKYSRPIPNHKPNESELRIDYPNGSRINLFGADNPDSLRGIALWGVVFDEYSQQPSNIFTEIIRPTLTDHEGYAIWIGTPKGKNEFYRLYEKAKKKENWLALHLTVEDSHIISEKELADNRETMSEDEFNQEYYCSFEAALKGAYYTEQIAQARKAGRITTVPYDERFQVKTWWDLGIGDATSIGFFQKVGMQWRMFDYYENSGEGLGHYASVLQDKGYNYSEHYAPHDIEVKELGTGQSRLEIAHQLGINFRVAPKLSIDDGINAVRLRFPTLWMDADRCSKFIDAISQYKKIWDDKRGEFQNKPYHDWTSHAADMLRYWAVTSDIEQKVNNLSIPKVQSYA